MMKRAVELTEDGLLILFRGMVCNAIEMNKVEHLVDNDPWGFSGCLDMSFEECLAIPLEHWRDKIREDLQEFVYEQTK